MDINNILSNIVNWYWVLIHLQLMEYILKYIQIVLQINATTIIEIYFTIYSTGGVDLYTVSSAEVVGCIGLFL